LGVWGMMHKIYWGRVFLLIGLWLSCVPYLLQVNEVMADEQKASVFQLVPEEEIAIAFDLHDVIFKLDAVRATKFVLGASGKLYLLKLFASPTFWKVFKNTKFIGSAEQRFNLLIHAYPRLKKYKQQFIELCNQQDIIPGMDTLLKRLAEYKEKGIRLFVASNIGKETCEHLMNKYPEIGSLFDGFFTSGSTPNFVKKPSKEYFEALAGFIKQKFALVNTIIFIDDKLTNTDAAFKFAGMKGLHFTCKKGLEKDLYKELAHLGMAC
jgi:FMN phosphatase YigB (HAD superfamily)